MSLLKLIINKFQGMSSLIAPEKLPPYVMKLLVNLEPAKLLGNLKKRTGYAQLINSGLTTLKSMYEFINKNDSRLLLVQDGTDMKQSVYSGGYGAILDNTFTDERTGTPTVDQAYPLEFNKEIRSPAGVNTSTDLPFWYGYIEETNRFNDNETISAGRYLDEQFYKRRLIGESYADDYFVLLFRNGSYGHEKAAVDEGWYAIYLVPILDGYQKGLPEYYDYDLDRGIVEVSVDDDPLGTATHGNIKITLVVDSSDASKIKRLTAIDIYIASLGEDTTENVEKYPAYFLERIDLNSDSNYFLTKDGDLDNTGGSEKISIELDGTWNSLGVNWPGLYIYDETNDETYRITSAAYRDDGGTWYLDLETDPVVTNSGTATLNFYSKWYSSAGDYNYVTFYDNYYKKLGSEMYSYLNIPTGDTGLDDYRHKYSAEAGNRLMIVGCAEDNRSAFFSVPYNLDVIPAQNRVRLKKEPKGVIGINNDFIIFYKDGAKRFSILSNGEYSADDDFADVGLVSNKALKKINDDFIVFMSYKGAYLITNRRTIFIGEDLIEWWEDTLTDSEKEACVVTYNDRKEQIWFSFPTYSTSPYTNGIIFVYDLRAHKKGLHAWWVLKTDVKIKNACLSDDLHLLTGNDTEIYDWNNDTPTETVDTKLQILLMKSPTAGRSKKTHWKTLYVDVDQSDTLTANAYFDGSGTPTALTFSGDMTAAMRYIAETLQIEIETSASTNDVEYSEIQLRFKPLGV